MRGVETMSLTKPLKKMPSPLISSCGGPPRHAKDSGPLTEDTPQVVGQGVISRSAAGQEMTKSGHLKT